MGIECFPVRFPRNASRRFPGGAASDLRDIRREPLRDASLLEDQLSKRSAEAPDHRADMYHNMIRNADGCRRHLGANFAMVSAWESHLRPSWMKRKERCVCAKRW